MRAHNFDILWERQKRSNAAEEVCIAQRRVALAIGARFVSAGASEISTTSSDERSGRAEDIFIELLASPVRGGGRSGGLSSDSRGKHQARRHDAASRDDSCS
jgi:hypothetical protein